MKDTTIINHSFTNQVKSITGAQALDSCLDPIIKTSVVGGRCLVEAHCSDLRNTECMADKDLRCSTGERSYDFRRLIYDISLKYGSKYLMFTSHNTHDS